MNTKVLAAVWGGLFILCAALGFIPEPTGAARWLLTGLSVVFFIPPMLMLRQARLEGNRDIPRLVRNLAASSLGLTVLALVASLITAPGSETLGTALHYALIVLSTPMIASGYWALSLFLWACVLITAAGAGKAVRGDRGAL